MGLLEALGYGAASLASSTMTFSSVVRYAADTYAGRAAEEVARNDLYAAAFVMVPVALFTAVRSVYNIRTARRGKSLI